METREIEERLELLEKLGGIIRRENKAHGLINAAWGAAILVGLLIFQAVELLSLPWYYGVASLAALLTAASVATVFLKRRIRGQLGYVREGWLGRKIGTAWAAVAFGGGIAYMLVFWSPSVSQAVFSQLPPQEVSGLILTGWLIIDGIGCMVQGVISESKAFKVIGLAMLTSAVIVAHVGFIFAWAAFALTFGLGYLLVGLRDYSEFKRSITAGVEVG